MSSEAGAGGRGGGEGAIFLKAAAELPFGRGGLALGVPGEVCPSPEALLSASPYGFKLGEEEVIIEGAALLPNPLGIGGGPPFLAGRVGPEEEPTMAFGIPGLIFLGGSFGGSLPWKDGF